MKRLTLAVAILAGSAIGCGDDSTGDPSTCAEADCGANSTCDDSSGDAVCGCEDGYTLQAEGCVDIDECGDGTDNCDPAATCANDDGGFTCSCPAGTNDVNGDGTQCSVDCTGDPSLCDTNASCIEAGGTVSCICDAGYEGDGATCTDSDECADGTDDCDPAAACTNIDGGFTCACPAGYTDDNGDGTLCTDIDECTDGTDDCDAAAVCTNIDGGFTCACPAGYTDDNGDGTLCTDIDECTDGTDNCGGACVNEIGGFTCCEAGQRLSPDGTQCQSLLACSSSSTFLYTVHVTDATTVAFADITAAGESISGCNGLAVHPTTGSLYGILKVSGFSGRALAILDVPTTSDATVNATIIGDTGINLAGITFDASGTLYAVSGDGGTPSETLFLLSTSTANATAILTLGNGSDGENILYCPDDGQIYHFSGRDSAPAFESIDPVTLTVTSIARTGFNYDEVHGSIWGWPTPGAIGIANLDRQILTVATTGEATMVADPYGMTNDTGANLFQVKGLVLVP